MAGEVLRLRRDVTRETFRLLFPFFLSLLTGKKSEHVAGFLPALYHIPPQSADTIRRATSNRGHATYTANKNLTRNEMLRGPVPRSEQWPNRTIRAASRQQDPRGRSSRNQGALRGRSLPKLEFPAIPTMSLRTPAVVLASWRPPFQFWTRTTPPCLH